MDAIKAFTSQIKSFRSVVFTTKERNKNATNKTPWAQPTILTASGKPAKYFSGIAINNNTKNEIPSAIAILLNQFKRILFVFKVYRF